MSAARLSLNGEATIFLQTDRTYGIDTLSLTRDGLMIEGFDLESDYFGHDIDWDTIWWLGALNAYGLCEGLRALSGET